MKISINKKQAELALLLGMAISVFCAGFCGFAEDYDNITDTVFRLHILANSDSEADQALKLKVRDAVLEKSAYLFENNASAEESARAAEEHLDEIRQTAEQVISENGSDYSVNCEVTEMYFDNRVYGTVTMPAGEYTALRITIGEAQGKNWWCVMFPPLCLPAAEKKQELSDVLSDGGQALVESKPKYEIRFWLIEKIEQLRKKA